MSGSGTVAVLDATAVAAALRPREAVRAVTDALQAGLDPSAATPRSAVPTAHGELLLMPAAWGDGAGVKVVSIAPANASLGLPRIQGVYVLFDEGTLTPLAVLDGAALTTLRTPAVSVAAISRALELGRRPARAVVYGAGPQGVGHLRALADTLRAGTPGADVVLEATVVVRDLHKAVLPPLDGVSARLTDVRAGDVVGALATADVVVCATTARAPLFAADAVGDDCVVVAVGAHEIDALEVDPALCGRATVVVEDRATALRESGVVRAAVQTGRLAESEVVPLRDVVTGVVTPERPVLFVSVGMAWEDLVVARRLYQAHQAQIG